MGAKLFGQPVDCLVCVFVFGLDLRPLSAVLDLRPLSAVLDLRPPSVVLDLRPLSVVLRFSRKRGRV